MTQEEEARRLAEDHWQWIEGLDRAAWKSPTPREEYLFMTALVHGFKHGVAWKESEHLEKANAAIKRIKKA